MPEPTQTHEESGESASTSTDVRTVLIADIRGYTTFTGERGDDAAAALATRFAEITAAVVTARGGQLVELRGDEALVVFPSTRQALRSALELQAEFIAAELPRGVGIGIDAGEAVRVGDGYRGSALNLAARLCALAGPGEVVASDAVVHLASTVEGIRYVSPRTVRVKGFSEPVRAVRVIASTDPIAPSRRGGAVRVDRRRLALLAAGLIGAVGTGVTLFALGMNRSDTPQPSGSAAAGSSVAATAPFDGPGLAFIDPETGMPIGERLAFATAVEVEYVEGAFWVLAFGPAALHRVEPETHAVIGTIPIGFSPGTWLVDGSTVWFTDYEEPLIHKLDAVSGRQVSEFRVSDEVGGLGGIAMGAGSLWVGVRDDPEGLLRIDPVIGRGAGSLPRSSQPTSWPATTSSGPVTSGRARSIASILGGVRSPSMSRSRGPFRTSSSWTASCGRPIRRTARSSRSTMAAASSTPIRSRAPGISTRPTAVCGRPARRNERSTGSTS